LPSGEHKAQPQHVEAQRQLLARQETDKGAPLAQRHGAYTLAARGFMLCGDNCPSADICEYDHDKGKPCPAVEDYKRERTAEIRRLTWIRETDLPTVRRLVLVELQLELLDAFFSLHGLVKVRGNTVDAQPAAKLYDALHKRMISLSDRLGLNPLARAKLEKERPAPLSPAELAGLLEDGDKD